MRRSTQRVLTGLGAVLLGACALSAAGPAQAAETSPTGTHVEITTDVSVYDLPRLNTAISAELHAGEEVQAFCAFSNDGREWVKVQREGSFGFVDSGAVRGGINGLPRTCPNEIESIEFVIFKKTFVAGELGVKLDEFTCPASYPYLDGRVSEDAIPFLDSQWDRFGKLYSGVHIERPAGVGVDLGGATVASIDGGPRYLAGFSGGSISNHAWVKQDASIVVTCTNNEAYAERRA